MAAAEDRSGDWDTWIVGYWEGLNAATTGYTQAGKTHSYIDIQNKVWAACKAHPLGSIDEAVVEAYREMHTR
jgi:hypothetical protein